MTGFFVVSFIIARSALRMFTFSREKTLLRLSVVRLLACHSFCYYSLASLSHLSDAFLSFFPFWVRLPLSFNSLRYVMIYIMLWKREKGKIRKNYLFIFSHNDINGV
jgi:hypothetical protein